MPTYRHDILQLFSSFATHDDVVYVLREKYDISTERAEEIIRSQGIKFPRIKDDRSLGHQQL